MGRTILQTSLLTLLLITLVFIAEAQINVALSAKVTTSHVSPWETLKAVNDGKEPQNSSDNSKGAYGNWNGESYYNTYNWVQYEWTNAQRIVSTSVYWWDDNGGIKKPTDAYIEYFEHGEWKNAGKIGLELNRYNTLDTALRTNKLRIYMVSIMSTGILEWKVMANESEPCEPTQVSISYQINQGEIITGSSLQATTGDTIRLYAKPDGGELYWTGPYGFTSKQQLAKIDSANVDCTGTYRVSYLNECGAFSTASIKVAIQGNQSGDTYQWPTYSPTLNYNFRDEFPALKEPEKDLDDCSGVAGTLSSGWWTFKWGSKANSLVTEAAIKPLLERMNTDFAYFRDVMGWPPDKRAKNGYRSAIYLFGSGLCTDNATNTDKGGWQSAITYNGQSWPMVLLSYYPVYSFDPACPYGDKLSQQGACVHEGIHSVLADLPGCKNAAWFHEGGNTWLQQEAESSRSGDYSSMGFLNGTSFIAPFMPIECYSGWLQDDSFGGPSAEGVNMFNGGQQICTWRNYLGGNQYGNSFPTFLGQVLGKGSIAWIWRNCPSRVLEGMASKLGEKQMRRLIMEYRAKQALLDMGEWTNAFKKLLDANFGISIKAEWQPAWLSPAVWIASPYAKTTTGENRVLTPEYRTTPGWSGANQIPLHVSGNKVVVTFNPKGDNMSCQLCYRAKDGTTVYSEPVYSGNCVLKLDKEPANGVVIAVICNTSYIYEGEVTRKAHFDYTLQMGEGVVRKAGTNKKWYNWKDAITDPEVSVPESIVPTTKSSAVYPNPVNRNQTLNIRILNSQNHDASLKIRNNMGQLLYSDSFKGEYCILNKTAWQPGIYWVTVLCNQLSETHKLLIQ
jgi:hypothetical protein